MKLTKAAAGLALAGVLVLGACSPHGGPSGPRQNVGMVSGALIGGAAGNVIGRGDLGSTVAGALIGGVVGGLIGADLDERDRFLAEQAQFEAFDSGRPSRWRGERDRNVYGEVIPGPTFRDGRDFCREYTHTIYIGGRPQEGYGTACRQPDGSWRIVS
ncbi:MAG: hypothetical protein EA385_06165 [Salinarimonadaceae bacterium]|nr:MAG: hypothetical protein EA385_06165 [Salinarimonadaceae bacterium]